ncbi:type II toxin-antitoxin system PemK/MazF family toxin [Lentilactobacillus sp. SPB1-3]|uniref:Type II toxin-antitoxin system PemK/MazF family toxin n=1 Tax=Lentilactobacillus terminaliae TaxID=3003483 RepID=A0ACD5DDD7_9LACO|nr:type II toxin-antitoxin system PemK/MazF family toxin [Lentilactobacillus sp. SPB1-3]MCZ0977994.1 type II toxin-antitoxin system PemK/MazF family toxin [Lentilactobacillus sp. SPB1-3]
MAESKGDIHHAQGWDEIKQGSICWSDLNPTLGHEQHGRRPVLVVSNAEYYKYTKMVKIVAISSSERQASFPLNVPLTGTKTKGFILTDQERAIDPENRNIELIEQAPAEILSHVLELIEETY